MTTSEARAGAATRQGFPVVMSLFAALAFVILVALGVWQIQRLHWKEGVLARIAALQAAPPRSVSQVLARARAGGDIDYTRVEADCPAIESSHYVRLYIPMDGGAGFRIITACRLTGAAYGSILVDRGSIAQDAVGEMDHHVPPLTQPIIGVLRRGDARNFASPDNQPKDGLYYWRDVGSMAHVLGAPDPAPTFLMLERPSPADVGPKPAPVPVDIPNNHLSYAITWFGLAASLAGVYLASLWRRRAR